MKLKFASRNSSISGRAYQTPTQSPFAVDRLARCVMRNPMQLGRLTVSLGLALIGSAVLLFLLSAPVRMPSALAAPGEFRVCNTTPGYSPTIQSAVDAAQSGDIIKVAAGVYTESKFYGGDYNLYISKTVHLYGGYTCADWT